MKLNRLVILLASAMAMVVVSMLGAVAAQAANEGPLWIVGNPAKGLLAGETRAITSRTEAPPVLHGSLASVECERATNRGVLLGGSPGTAFVEIKFEECRRQGAFKNCVATGLKLAGANAEIPVNVLVILGFPVVLNRNSAVALFAAEGVAGNEQLFTEFEFKNKVGATTELCGALNEAKISVKAAGTPQIKIKTETRNVGQIAEVGMLESEGVEKFFLSTPGLTSTIGLLRFPETVIKEAEVWNSSTEKYEAVKAELSAGALLGEVHEIANTEIATNPQELFGWNH
jgi:hypothetical protein